MWGWLAAFVSWPIVPNTFVEKNVLVSQFTLHPYFLTANEVWKTPSSFTKCLSPSVAGAPVAYYVKRQSADLAASA